MTSRGTSPEPEPAPVLTSTASGPEEEHLGPLAFSFLPSDEEMDEMAHHLDLRHQQIQDDEPEDAGDNIFEEIKYQHHLDLDIYESLLICIKDETTRRSEAAKKAFFAANPPASPPKPSQTPSPTASPPGKKAKRQKKKTQQKK